MTLPRNPDHDLERLLGDDHGEFGALYRRLARSEPPRRLDRAVLGEAARAVRGRAPRKHRWLVGLGSAAGIVLAAGIAWRVGQEAAMQPSAITAPAPAAVDVVPVQPISEQARRAEPAPTTDDFADAPAAAPAPAAAAKREAAADSPKQKAKPGPRKPPAPPPPPSEPVVEQAQPAPAPAPFPAAPESTVAGDGAGPERGARAGAPAAKSAATEEHESAPQRLRARAAPAPSASVELRRDQQLAPDAWLAQVRDLLRQGRRQQAAESLRLFHRTHPRHAVPEDLRNLLE
jgi:hypothetical protein